MARPQTCQCGTCTVCRRRAKAAEDRQLLTAAKKQLVQEAAPPRPAEEAPVVPPGSPVPAPPSPSPPAAEAPVRPSEPVGEARAFGTSGGQRLPDPPRLRLVAAPPPSSAPRPDPSSWQDAPLDLEAEPARDPEEQAASWEAEMARRMSALTPVGLMIAEGLAANVERNRVMSEQLGMPWPRLSSRPEDAQFLAAFQDMYLEACKYTVAMFLPTRQGKYTPVAVCVGGQIGSTVAVQLAARRAEGNRIPAADQPNEHDAEAEIVPPPGTPAWRSPLDLAGVPRGGEE